MRVRFLTCWNSEGITWKLNWTADVVIVEHGEGGAVGNAARRDKMENAARKTSARVYLELH
jgi:hypothetical protein